MEFWSPLPIAWTAVTGIIELHLLIGMMVYLFMTWTVWHYVNLAAVVVMIYHTGERPDRMLPI